MDQRREFGSGPFLLLLDESTNKAIRPNTESLTGLLVPVQKIDAVRQGFYEVLRTLDSSAPHIVNMAPPEIKFSSLLPDQADDVKLRVVAGIVRLVSAKRLSIFRVAYYLTDEVKQKLSADQGLTSLNWGGIQTVIQPVLDKGIVIPVIDGGFDGGFRPIADKFAFGVKSCDMIRSAGHGESLSIRHTENLCEAVFADSRHSVLIQVVDMIAGLRRLAETARVGPAGALSPFKQLLLGLAGPLDELVVYDETIEFRIKEAK
jgi:hypothetical protein